AGVRERQAAAFARQRGEEPGPAPAGAPPAKEARGPGGDAGSRGTRSRRNGETAPRELRAGDDARRGQGAPRRNRRGIALERLRGGGEEAPPAARDGDRQDVVGLLVSERGGGGGVRPPGVRGGARGAEDRDRAQAGEALEGARTLLWGVSRGGVPEGGHGGTRRAGVGALAGGREAPARRAGGLRGAGDAQQPRPPLRPRPDPRLRRPREGARGDPSATGRLGRHLRGPAFQGRRRPRPRGALRDARDAAGALRGAFPPDPPLTAAGAAGLPLARRAPAGRGKARSRQPVLRDPRRASPGRVLELPREV